MQKLLKKVSAVLSAFIFAAVMMFSPLSCSGFFRPVSGSLGVSALPIRAEEQPVTDESKGIAALLALLFANGIRFVGQWDDVSAGAVKLWNDFTTATGNTVTLAALGAGVAVAQGYMRTSATVNNAVNAFQSWYEGAFSVPTTGEISIPISSGGTYAILDNGCHVYTTATYNNTNYYDTMYISGASSEVRGAVFRKGSSISYGFVSRQPFSVSTSINNGDMHCYVGTDPAFSSNGYYYYRVSNVRAYENNMTYDFLSNVILSDFNGDRTVPTSIMLAYTFGESAIGDISIEGQSYELKDGYNLNTDQSLLLDIANLSALVASIGLTLDSINDLVQDWPAIFDTPWADTDVPDITFPVPIADTPDNTIPWVNVPDAVSPDPVPDYVPDTPETEGEYKVLGLENVFPFSIPFDLYYLVNVLVAEPETPSFTYALYDPTTSSLVSQEVNLHQFDTFAALLRKLETVLFIASLIFVTRGLIRS